MFCPHSVKCDHWGNKINDEPKCYYGEPQCWKGKLDYTIELFFGIAPFVMVGRLRK